MKKRLLSALLALIMLIAPLTVPAYAYQPGEEIGQVLYTDIVAYIDGHAIRSYNINWNTYIVVEDLMAYGFAVSWLPEEGRLVIAKDRTAAPDAYTANYQPEANTHPAGTPAMPYLYTEITTWIGDTQVTGYNIGGYTCICMDDLAAHFAGGYVWSPEDKALYMTSPAFADVQVQPTPEEKPAETPAEPEQPAEPETPAGQPALSGAAAALDGILRETIALYTGDIISGEDVDSIVGYDEMYGEGFTGSMLDMWSEFYSELTYEITGSEEDGEAAVVYVTIHCRDLNQALSNYITLYMAEILRTSLSGVELTDDAMNALATQILHECMTDPELPFVTRETAAYMELREGQWYLSDSGNEDFSDALMGGYLSSPILEAMLESGAEEEDSNY